MSHLNKVLEDGGNSAVIKESPTEYPSEKTLLCVSVINMVCVRTCIFGDEQWPELISQCHS